MKKAEIQKRNSENSKLARELQRQLKSKFEEVIDNPTEKKIREYKDYEYALLAVWLKKTYTNLSNDIDEAVKDGRATAIEQLRGKGFSKDTDIDELYKRVRQAKKRQIKADLEKVVAGIIQNSNKNIEQMVNAMVYQKKKLTDGFFGTLKKYGIAYFLTNKNARYKLEDYIAMETQTAIVSVERQAMFVKSVEYGNDLVKVVHTGNDEPCPLCEPFQDKTLSITGKTKGYMSVAEAQSYGLFHPNCYDVLELAPEEPDAKIEIDESNSKYHAKYNG